MRVGVGIAIIVIASSTLIARGQSLQEQDICAKQAREHSCATLGTRRKWRRQVPKSLQHQT